MIKDELIKKIQEANSAYAAGIPFMPDSEYDILWQELYNLEPENKLLYHTARNTANLTGAITHRYPVYGTSKAFNSEDLKPFLMRFGSKELIIEPKYDGCAAVLELTTTGWELALEGDGLRGAAITFLLPHINFPFTTRHYQTIEIIIPWADWDPAYGKNPRNVVSGWTNPTRKAVPPAKMTAVPHNFNIISQLYKYDGDLDALNELLLKLHTEWKEIFPIDGLMIKVADEKSRLLIGTDGSRNAWSIAWKPPIQTAVTTVLDIEWNVSRLGRVIPTVIYSPIELCGTLNQRVTGNNAQWILARQIQVRSKILVGKAGEIIPKILAVDNSLLENKIEQKIQLLPRFCPMCRSELSWNGVHLVCLADNCIAKLITSLSYFYSAKGIMIDGIGEATIEKILLNQKCYEVLRDRPWALLDIFNQNILDDIISVLGPKIFDNLFFQVNLISGSKNMAHFISGLGLPGLAYKTSLRLCQFLKTGRLNIPVSETSKNNFIVAVKQYNQAANEMLGFKFAPLPSSAKAIYCVTGTVSMARDTFIEKLSLFNYEFNAGVTRETNYLIIGDNPGKTKIIKAEKHNIPMITETQLAKLIPGWIINF